MLKPKIDQKENKITIAINPQFYPPEAIYGAAYVFMDRAFIFLDGDPKNQVLITLKGKEKLNQKKLNDLSGEFCNEILNYSLRNRISKNNQKIREAVVLRALSVMDQTERPPQQENKKNPPQEKWQNDTLGIALPWEKKYEK